MTVTEAGSSQVAGWEVTRWSGAAGELHGIDPPPDGGRQVWIMEPTRPALVLGSTQRDSVVNVAALGARGIELARRRSGGGAVLVTPDDGLWVDVMVPSGDPWWDDDVAAAFGCIGRAWRDAIGRLGFSGEAHAGRLVRSRFSSLVCFAGLGPGEVLVGGRKVVGLSQRRTRSVARFQSIVYVNQARIDDIVSLVIAPAEPGGGPGALAAWLKAHTAALPVTPEELVSAFLGSLARTA